MTINIDSVHPIYPHYGVYQGVPIARHYIDKYFESIAHSIHGKVLEFGAPTYAASLDCEYDIIDISKDNPVATIYADICDDWISLDRPDCYDCVICTAVLQLVPNPQKAVEHMYAVLKPGGVLILAEKSVSKIDSWYGSIDRWRFTPRGLEYLLRSFSKVSLNCYGNVYVVCAYLLGLPVEVVDSDKLAQLDPEHPLVTIARAEK